MYVQIGCMCPKVMKIDVQIDFYTLNRIIRVSLNIAFYTVIFLGGSVVLQASLPILILYSDISFMFI